MTAPGQLVDQGVRAYVEGRLEDARRLLEEALRLEPANARARGYLELLWDGPPPAAPPAPPAAAAPPAAPPLVEVVRPAAAPEPPAGRAAPPAYAPSPWDDGPAMAPTIVLEAEGGMDLDAVAEKSDIRTLVPEAPGARPPLPDLSRRGDVDVWMTAARDLHALGDFTGSLELIEKILKADPVHREARSYLRENEATLIAMYESKLGPLGRVPRLAIKPEEVLWLNLDHRAGFLLAQVDGSVDYESLFALSGLPRLDTARILATLLSDGVISA